MEANRNEDSKEISLTLIDQLNENKKDSIYTFVLLDKIEYDDNRIDKKFDVHISIIDKPEDTQQIKPETTILHCSEKELGIKLPLQKPEPQIKYMNVNLSPIPLTEGINPYIRDIRLQIIHKQFPIKLDGKEYYINVETGYVNNEEGKENRTANYYLYDYKSIDYETFIKSFGNTESDNYKQLREICKQWNDKEYIELTKSVKDWQKKADSPDVQDRINYFNAALGKFECWYPENKNDSPTLKLKNNKLSLIKRLKELCIADNLPKGETVDSKKVNHYLRQLQKEGLTKSNSDNTIRKTLSRLGYSKENS
ncbi:MAG: hypothetical protein ABR980_02265 [Ignavibacteriaceae bacterium]|jgi:hypothetical protein